MQITEKINRREPLLFFLILLIHLFPVFLLTPFVTLDGPVHLYNAQLIKSLILGDSGIADRFFSFNPIIQPNLTIHAISAILLTFLPALIVEKCIILLIFLTGTLGFRKLVLILNPGSGWMSWLYFPFLYNFAFSLGFFNFSFGFALLPWIIGLWLRKNENLNLRFSFLLFVLFLIAFFSHIFIFLIAVMMCKLITLKDVFKQPLKSTFINLMKLALIALPGLILSLLFILNKGTGGYRGEISWLSHNELLHQIMEARMFIVFNYETESKFTCIFFYAMLIFTVLAYFKRSMHIFQKPFLWIAVISLLLVFVVPDAMSSGGFLSIRIVQLFFFCWIIWLVSLNIPVVLRISIGLFAAGFSLFMISQTYSVRKDLSNFAGSYIDAEKIIKPGSVILPLNYGDNWLHANLSAYLATNKNVIILDNYEASTNHFPLIWKENMKPEMSLGNFTANKNACLDILNFEKITKTKIDYISIENEPQNAADSCIIKNMEQVRELFVPLKEWSNEFVKVYERK